MSSKNNNSDLIIRNIFEVLPVGVMVIRPDGTIATVNPALTEILGIVREDMVDRNWIDLFIPGDDGETPEIADVILGAVQWEAVDLCKNLNHIRPDSSSVHICVSSSYLKDGDEVVGIVLLVMDETERQDFAERENKHLREIRQLQDERVQGLNKLAMAVAHKIRNPLMTIGGFSNLLLREFDKDSTQVHHLHTIIEESKRLEHMVKSVRDYANIRAAHSSRVPSCVLLAELEEYAHKKAGEADKKIEWITACPVVDFVVDHELFLRAMQHLVDNAFDFTPWPIVRIRIVVEPGDNDCRISVLDRGMGVGEDHLPFVFDPFYSSKPNGQGMGLPVARRIIAEHGGTLKLARRENSGTEAGIWLGEHSLEQDSGHRIVPPVIPGED